MAALNNAAVGFDDAAEAVNADSGPINPTSRLSNRLVTGQAAPASAPNFGRRPNVPAFGNGFTTYSPTNRAVPPRPLAGAGIRTAPIPAGNGLVLAPPRRARPRRSPFLAIVLPHPLIWLVGVLAVMLLGFVLLSNLVQWWQTWQDDLAYGRPRTFQLDAWVGHNEQSGHPTHLIAQNIDRQISVIEYPGGDPSKTRVLVGPRLFGAHDDLTPVKLRLADVNGDGHVDLIVNVAGQHIIYINDNGQFRLLRPEERAQISLPPDN